VVVLVQKKLIILKYGYFINKKSRLFLAGGFGLIYITYRYPFFKCSFLVI